MKYVYLLLLTLLISTHTTLNGQASLSLTTSSVSNSTPALGTQISILTELTNASTTDTFTGIINFSLANKDSIITNLSIVGYPSYAGTSITLAPQQSRTALFTVQIQPTYFAVGPDIIIVWPVASHAHVLDTAAAPITITWPTDITSPGMNNISVYVANENLIVLNTIPKAGAEQLRIFDVLGNIIISYPLIGATTTIPVNNLPAGIYIATIFNEYGEHKTVKFVR